MKVLDSHIFFSFSVKLSFCDISCKFLQSQHLHCNNRRHDNLVATVVNLEENFFLESFIINALSFQCIKDRFK